ncbi:hypothetical protein FIBSPDRAFT_881425 [Athelia psychrophila]|uniref:Secreted protein n=1 Tax=Athelia psychrophila TaxID=1759441 RepID=A0A166WNK6_9AGAM|nr:hypothetical protein FIBSPDRAFT_881425 [Fibularhizoctonia sp. CBS 109695]
MVWPACTVLTLFWNLPLASQNHTEPVSLSTSWPTRAALNPFGYYPLASPCHTEPVSPSTSWPAIAVLNLVSSLLYGQPVPCCTCFHLACKYHAKPVPKSSLWPAYTTLNLVQFKMYDSLMSGQAALFSPTFDLASSGWPVLH